MNDISTFDPRDWDIVVVGAGPAGALAAMLLARGGFTTLLIERSVFPRSKLCGCTINSAAQSTLDSVGLGDLISRQQGRLLSQLRLGARGVVASIPLEPTWALSRLAFDQALVTHAQSAGAIFLSGTIADMVYTDSDYARISLRSGADTCSIRAKLVIAADGLGSSILTKISGVASTVQTGAPIGIGAIVDTRSRDIASSQIGMAVGECGYVGLSCLEDGRLNIAAAILPDWLRSQTSPAKAMNHILERAGFGQIEGLSQTALRGTPTLRRSRQVIGATRVLAIGDSAGYHEPFTGEGIAWALASAVGVLPFARQAIASWDDRLIYNWTRAHQSQIVHRSWVCKRIASITRHEWMAAAAVRVLRVAPGLCAPITRFIANKDSNQSSNWRAHA